MRTLVLVALLSAPLALAQNVPCESIDGSYRECRVSSSGIIRLTYEMSDARCYEGVTWGTKEGGVVWVSRGCRAMFIADREKSTLPPDRIVCESENGGRKVCPANTRNGIRIARQLSAKPCNPEVSWGYDKSHVWVDDGCRAEFVLGPEHVQEPQPALEGVTTCQSLDGRRVECRADTSAGVQLIRTFTADKCSFGTDWGYDRKGIWVANLCRAAFAVKRTGAARASSIVCESSSTRSNCAADTMFGVALARQLSEKACVLDETWGFDATGVWVTGGCSAQFALGGYRLPPDAVPPGAQKVICDSLDGSRNVCAADTTRGVGLVRQLGDIECVLNRTWGYERDAIWVSGGCNAEFAVGH